MEFLPESDKVVSDQESGYRETRLPDTCPAFKAKVLAAIKGEKTLTNLAQPYDVHANQITASKAQLVDGVGVVFGSAAGTKVALTVDVRMLHAKVGELAMENESLVGALSKAGRLLTTTKAQTMTTVNSADAPGRQYRFLTWITVAYVVFQLISDVTAGKIISVFGFPTSIAVLYFPVTYLFSDILTEVYGYEQARAILWKVLFASITAGLIYQLAVYWPPAAGFAKNQSYVDVFSQVPRILIGGWLAIFFGDIVNNYVMAKIKILMHGRMLWVRAITSTIAGQGVNTVIFYVVGLYGVIPTAVLFEAVVTSWLLKSSIEAVLLPFTYAVCRFLKREEGIDFYDINTNFNPFIMR